MTQKEQTTVTILINNIDIRSDKTNKANQARKK